MIGRLRGRACIEELRRHGRRVRRGPLGVLAMTGSDAVSPSFPEVGFAIGRRVGSAVVRNRRRRQLRAILGQVRAEDPALLPAGRYLVSLAPTDVSFAELRQCTRDALTALHEAPATPRRDPNRSAGVPA